MGQCEIPFPAAAVRVGSNYLKTAIPLSNKSNNSLNIGMKKGLIGSSSSSSSGCGVGTGQGAGVGVFRSHHGPHAKHRTLNGSSSNFNHGISNSIEKSNLKGVANISNNIQISSFADGHQFTSRDLWLRMKSKGDRLTDRELLLIDVVVVVVVVHFLHHLFFPLLLYSPFLLIHFLFLFFYLLRPSINL